MERGYFLEVEEFVNDLDGRQTLGTLILRLDEPLGAKMNAILQPWDERFIQATVEVDKPQCTRMRDEELGPWCYRAPKDLGDYPVTLEDWLKSLY